MKLIVGLGNPGQEYVATRHNVGFRCLQYLARKHRLTFSRRECRARVAPGEIASCPVLLARPHTYMNLSGTAVGCLVRKHRLPLSDLLVIYDDMDLPPGEIRLRPRGSAGGHHGMQSIIAALPSGKGQDFPRMRIGIGPPVGDPIGYVLGHFGGDEGEAVAGAIRRAAEAVECLLREGIEAAMNKYN
ncbi:MAG: aminoacyl-tRNA hydrolase [Dehalococcoidia bacterium]